MAHVELVHQGSFPTKQLPTLSVSACIDGLVLAQVQDLHLSVLSSVSPVGLYLQPAGPL